MMWIQQGKTALAIAAISAAVGAGAQAARLDGPNTSRMLRSVTIPSPSTSTDFSTSASATTQFAQFQPMSFEPVVSVEPPDPSVSDVVSDAPALPDSPGTLLQTAAPVPHIDQPLQGIMPPQDPPQGHAPMVAPLREKYIPAGYSYYHLTAKDKVYIGFRDLYSVGNFAAIVLSAAYEQPTNGAPNYGTDKGAFGERLGAAGIRETTEGIFTDCVFSPMFQEDPRYFVEGVNHPFFNRAFHVVTRVFVTRTDTGGHTINGALLVGYAASTALQSAYYPQINRNAKDALAEYGGSLGGAALGFAADEFVDDILEAVHLKKKP